MGNFKDWWERNFVADDPYYERDETVQIDLTPAPKPRLVHVRQAPTRDEWAAWRDGQVTQFVMASLSRLADEHSDRWHQLSWVGGVADQQTLDALRERADALRGIAEADYEAFCETLELEPEAKPQNAA